MKTTHALTLMLAFGALTAPPLSSTPTGKTKFSARAMVGYAKSTNNPSAVSAVASLAGAARFDDTNEMNIEVTLGKWKTPLYENTDDLVEAHNERHFQLLLNYRYNLYRLIVMTRSSINFTTNIIITIKAV